MFLLGDGLESTVTEFGARIDELEVDLLERPSLGLHEKRLRRERFAVSESAANRIGTEMRKQLQSYHFKIIRVSHSTKFFGST